MTEPTEMLPCPFCGGINIIHCGHHMYCHACGADGPDADSQHESEAIAAWNTRTPQPTQAQAGAITPPPIECNTEELKRAYAFGWWSALEKQRETAQAGAVPLTDEQIDAVAESMPGGLDGFLKGWGWRQFAREILTLRRMPDWEPQFDCMTPKQEELAIQFCQEIAGPRGKPGSPPDPVRLLEMAEALYKAERDAANGIKGGQHGAE